MNEYVVNIDEILDNLDISFRETDFDSVDGVAMDGVRGKCIIIDSKLDPYHKRFTIAHEVGHFLTHTVDSQHQKYSEQLATKSWLDVLITDEKLKEARDFYGDDWDGYAQLFGVSQEVFEMKCRQLYWDDFNNNF